MKKILYSVALILLTQWVNAQVLVNNDLKNLITQSFTYFPKVKETQNTVETAREKLDIARVNNPVIDGNAMYNFVEPKITLPIDGKEFQFAPVHNANINVSASYTLLDFGRLKSNVEKAKTDLQFAQHNVEYVKSDLANQVAILYYNIVFFKRAITIQDSVLNYLNENKKIVESKLKNGDAIKIDLLNIQADIDAAQNRKIDFQNSLQRQQNLLAYTTGQMQANGKAFDFDVNVKNVSDIFNEAQSNNIEYVLAKDKIKQAVNEVGIAKTGDKPSVNIGANTGFKNGYVPYVNDLRFNYAAGVSLKLPIYDGGKTKRQVKLAETIVKQNELSVETLNNNYRKDIEQALTDIQSNIDRIKNMDGQIEQVKVAQELATTRFKNDIGTNLEITNASTNVQRAELNKLQYEYQLCLAKVELARLMGYKYWQ